jgi:hypothetical protein
MSKGLEVQKNYLPLSCVTKLRMGFSLTVVLKSKSMKINVCAYLKKKKKSYAKIYLNLLPHLQLVRFCCGQIINNG